MDRNAFAVDALKRALEGIVVVDRRKTADRVKTHDRPDLRIPIALTRQTPRDPGRILPIMPS